MINYGIMCCFHSLHAEPDGVCFALQANDLACRSCATSTNFLITTADTKTCTPPVSSATGSSCGASKLTCTRLQGATYSDTYSGPLAVRAMQLCRSILRVPPKP